MKRIFYILIILFVSITTFGQKIEFTENIILSDTGYCGNINGVDSSFVDQLITTQPVESLSINKNWWAVILSIFFLFFVTYIFNYYSDIIPNIIKASYQKIYFRQIIGQGSSIFSNFFIVINIIFIIYYSLIVFLYATEYTFFVLLTNVEFYFIIVLAIAVFMLIKLISAKILSYVFENKHFISAYYNSVQITNFLTLPFLTILILIALFNNSIKIQVLYIGFFIILIAYLLRIWLLAVENFRQGFSLFYLILYLCIVEILPIFIVIKYYSVF